MNFWLRGQLSVEPDMALSAARLFLERWAGYVFQPGECRWLERSAVEPQASTAAVASAAGSTAPVVGRSGAADTQRASSAAASSHVVERESGSTSSSSCRPVPKAESLQQRGLREGHAQPSNRELWRQRRQSQEGPRNRKKGGQNRAWYEAQYGAPYQGKRKRQDLGP